jgi:apolipoprotein D and lipocalin family protein
MPRLLLLAGLLGCSSPPPMPTVEFVDLDRFMGDWYVIAHIPASLEKNAYGAIESYRLADDGTIETTFTFREGSFDGEKKTYTPKGFVRDGKTNAEWGMQFVWPIKADYRIVHLDADYQVTIIGRAKRDYVWIMARQPEIDEARYADLVQRVADLGYDVAKLRKVPQR